MKAVNRLPFAYSVRFALIDGGTLNDWRFENGLEAQAKIDRKLFTRTVFVRDWKEVRVPEAVYLLWFETSPYDESLLDSVRPNIDVRWPDARWWAHDCAGKRGSGIWEFDTPTKRLAADEYYEDAEKVAFLINGETQVCLPKTEVVITRDVGNTITSVRTKTSQERVI